MLAGHRTFNLRASALKEFEDFLCVTYLSRNGFIDREVEKVFKKKRAIISDAIDSYFGEDEIRSVAQQRLKLLQKETKATTTLVNACGYVWSEDGIYVSHIALLATRIGVFEGHSATRVNDQTLIDKLMVCLHTATPIDPIDLYSKYWNTASLVEYKMDVYAAIDNAKRAFMEAMHRFPLMENLPILEKLKGVEFINVLNYVSDAKNKRDLMSVVRSLLDGLVFTKLLVMESRAYLFAGVTDHGLAFVRKDKSKIPDEFCVCMNLRTEYDDEDKFVYLDKREIAENDVVVILDDVFATGGTAKAGMELVRLADRNAIVAKIVAPFLADSNDGDFLCDDSNLLSKLVYYKSRKEIAEMRKPCPLYAPPRPFYPLTVATIFVVPPSFEGFVGENRNRVVVTDTAKFEHYVLGATLPLVLVSYAFSASIHFDATCISDARLVVMVNTQDPAELNMMLDLARILGTKMPRKVDIYAPFIDTATQDRIDFDPTPVHGGLEGWQSVASIQGLAFHMNQLLPNCHIYTFDLHAEQSQMIFSRMVVGSLVKDLLKRFFKKYPDAVPVFPDGGAEKRYSTMLSADQREKCIVFTKKRVGTKREITTIDTVPENVHCVIIDDMLRSGATLGTVAKYLRGKKASKITALFAHAAFETTTAFYLRQVDDVWTTNSCPRNVSPEMVKLDVVDAFFDF